MKLLINGESKEVQSGLSLIELLQHLKLDGPVAVELNRQVVPRAQHADTSLADGDSLEIVHFVGGG